MTIHELNAKKAEKQKLSMVTCYDFWSAKILAESPIDMILVGDSAAMVMHGHGDTIPADIEMMVTHTSAVRKGAPKKFIIADLPFLSFRGSLENSLGSVKQVMQAGANAVKLEGFSGNSELIVHLTESGIPVMGHVGLTPQFVNAFGGFKVQGREGEQRQHILKEALGLQDAGCFSVVLECVPSSLAGELTERLRIPTIGIGAGPYCDGQVLVLHDLLGLTQDFSPRFVRRYLQGAELIKGAVQAFHADVVSSKFPAENESFT